MLDTFLEELSARGADALQLIGGHPPILFFGGEKRHLTHEPLDIRFVHTLAASRLSAAEADRLELNQLVKGNWQTDDFGLIDFVFRQVNEQLVLALRPSQKTDKAPKTSNAADRIIAKLNQVDDLESLLIAAVLEGASDIVMSQNRMVRVRFGKGFYPLENHVLTAESIERSVSDEMTDRKRLQLESDGSADLAVEFERDSRSFRFRVNLFRQFEGIAAAWRPIWDEIPNFGDLSLPKEIQQLLNIDQGLILITGPTGSGKSTTVAALIDQINRCERRHIVTLAEPVEYRFQDELSMIHQREVGVHVDSFATGLRAALREAPNIIFVGEMRDLETIGAALTAAETGHLVVSTLHSGSCIQAIDRMIDVFPEHQQQQVRTQLADVLRAVVTQRLLARADGALRVPACEVLVTNYAVSNLIRERRTHQMRTNLQTGQSQGMLSLERSLIRLLDANLIEQETALRAAHDPKLIEKYLEESL